MWHSRWRRSSNCIKTVNSCPKGLRNVRRALSTLCSAPTLAVLCHNMVQNRTYFTQYLTLLKNGNRSSLWSPGGFSCKGVSLTQEVHVILALQADLLIRNVCITAGWYLSVKIPLSFSAQLPPTMGCCPSWVIHFPGVSWGAPGFSWSWGDDDSSPLSLRQLLPLSDSAVPVRWLVYSCNTRSVWGPFPYPLDFPFAKEPVGVCCYGDSKHLWTPLSLGAAAGSLLK